MTRWQKPISIAFGVYSAVLFVAYLIFLLANRSYVGAAEVPLVESLLTVTTFSFLGFLLSYRRPENVISWLFVVIALLRQTVYFQPILVVSLLKGIEPTFWLLFLGNLSAWTSGLAYTLIAFVIVLFPTGRLPSPRWRPAVWLLGLQTILVAGLVLFLTYDLYRAFSIVEGEEATIFLTPLVPDGFLSIAIHVRTIPELSNFTLLLAIVAMAMVLLALWAQIVRYRRGDSIVRQQIKWVIFAVVLWFLVIVVVLFVPTGIPINTLLAFAPVIPITIAVSILRYRIFDIDLIIRRTLVYGTLTILLGLIYFGTVTLLQSLVSALSGQESPLIIVISTLVIAALFAPLRKRLQNFIDRRFYRQKYDAEQVLAQFATTARDEVDLNRLTAELQRVVEKTMQPESVSLWLKER